MSLVERAAENEITAEIQAVADGEGLPAETVRRRVAEGRIVVPANKRHNCRTVGIGKGLRTKINASIGTSTAIADAAMEVEKARIAQEAGADTLMDLSVGGDIKGVRQAVMREISLPVGTVPLYEAFAISIEKYGAAVNMPEELLFEIIERQCEEGVSFMAIHCGINRMTIERLRKQNYRFGGLVSKGGSYLTAWMLHNNKENPLYEHFDRVAAILKKYDVVLSLGNGFRAGAIGDSTDRVQIQELVINCELADIGRKQGCQMMVEGPGHIPIDEIEANIILQKRMSNEAPFYMLGPITTDIAPGYDHVTAAIGQAISSSFGADFLCYVTPAEHVGLPYPEDVREGVTTARIAAHIGDMVKFKDRRRDLEMSKARRDLDWKRQFELALAPDRAREIKKARGGEDEEHCSMCGEFCASKVLKGMFNAELAGGCKA
ncbi:MAG: phosphomethylpyrimidine synthase ThiC [Nitrospirae bacterium]|nr:phosphomethylpyrimidine synthase ThiC [Nitrospirota bacterium]